DVGGRIDRRGGNRRGGDRCGGHRRGGDGRRGRRRSAGVGEGPTYPERDLRALRDLVLELLVIGASGCGGRRVAARRVAYGRRVNPRRHVVARQPGGAR